MSFTDVPQTPTFDPSAPYEVEQPTKPAFNPAVPYAVEPKFDATAPYTIEPPRSLKFTLPPIEPTPTPPLDLAPGQISRSRTPPGSVSTTAGGPPLQLPDAAVVRAQLGEIAAQVPIDVAAGFGLQKRALQAGIEDIASIPANIAGYTKPAENIRSIAPLADSGQQETPLPTSKRVDETRGLAGLPGRIVINAIGTLPKLAGITMAGPLAGQMIAAGGLFGLDDEGNFHPKEAAISAALPGIGRLARVGVAAGIGNVLAKGGAAPVSALGQKVLETAGEQVAMNAYMAAVQAPELAQLARTNPEEFRSRLAEIIGTNLAFALMGAKNFKSDVPSETKMWIIKNADALSRKTVLSAIAPEDLKAVYNKVKDYQENPEGYAGPQISPEEEQIVSMIDKTLQVGEKPIVDKGLLAIQQDWPAKLAQTLGVPERYGYLIPSETMVTKTTSPSLRRKQLTTGGTSAVNPIEQQGGVPVESPGVVPVGQAPAQAEPGNRVPSPAGQPTTAPVVTPTVAPTVKPAIVLKPDMETARRIAAMTPQEFFDNAQSFNKINLKLGQNASPADVEELKRLRDVANQRLDIAATRASAPNATFEDKRNYGILSSMPQFFNEAIAEAEKRAVPPETPKSSTQLTLPAHEATPFVQFARSIPDADVYHKPDSTGKEDYGIETQPHITVLYGLTKHEPAPVAKIVATKSPITVTLGKTSFFSGKDYDVLKVDVSGKDLHALNAEISKLPNEQTHPTYQPHLTIAYLKKGIGAKYAGNDQFEGKKITFNSVTFSPPQKMRAEMGKPELPFKAAPAPKVLNESASVRATAPEGATQIRVTDTKGRQSIQPIADVNKGANPFLGVEVKRVEAGTIGKGGKFLPMKGPLTITEVPTKALPVAEMQASLGDETLGQTSGSGGTLGEAAESYLRGSVSADPSLAEGPDGRRRQAGILSKWAADNGKLLTDDPKSYGRELENRTSEHYVRYDPTTQQVIKWTYPGTFGHGPIQKDIGVGRQPSSPLQYLERLRLQNTVFDDSVKVLGFQIFPDKGLMGRPSGLSIVTSQPYIKAADPAKPNPTRDEVWDYMEKLGFEADMLGAEMMAWTRSDGVLVTDARPDNFIKTKEGIVPIDLQISQASAPQASISATGEPARTPETPPVVAHGIEELRALVPHMGLHPQAQAYLSEILKSPLADRLPKLLFRVKDALENGWQGSAFQKEIEITRNANPITGVHELLHLIFEELPPDILGELERMRVASLNGMIEEAKEQGKDETVKALTDIRDHPTAGGEDFLSRGYPVALRSMLYPFSSTDEFFAHSASERFKQKVGSKVEGFWDRVRRIIADFIGAIKRALRLKLNQREFLDRILRADFKAGGDTTEQIEREAQGSLSPDEQEQRQADVEEGMARKGMKPTEVFGTTNYVLDRPEMTPEQIQHSLDVAQAVAAKAGFTTTIKPALHPVTGQMTRYLIFDPTGFDMTAEGKKLLELAKATVNEIGRPGVHAVESSALLAAIRTNFELAGMGIPSAFADIDMPTRAELFRVAQSPISYVAMMLGAQAQWKPDLTLVSMNIDVALYPQLYDAFGGPQVESVISRVLTNFRDLFTDKEVADIIAGRPDAAKTIDFIIAANQRDQAGRVYRRVQQQLGPKTAKTIAQKERDAKFVEEVSAIIEAAKKAGIVEPENKTRPLRPLEKLRLMVSDTNIEKIEGGIQAAFEEAKTKAGYDAWRKEATTTGDPKIKADVEDRIAVGEVPDDKYIAQGLTLPKYEFWQRIFDNWLGYSPITLDLVKKVLLGDFRGLKFGEAKARPADTRINIAELAKAPEAEAQRVMDNFLTNVEANVDIAGATYETKQRVRSLIENALASQLAAARHRLLDNFFNPKTNPPTTASQRLRQLINAGVDNDPRFKTDRVRQLIHRVANQYTNAKELDSLATSTRPEKQQWLEIKADEIAKAEGFSGEDPATSEYLNAVVWTHLAERLQAAEEKLTRAFLKGSDVKFEHAPVTQESRARSLEEAKSKLEGIIRAGGLDTPMIEAAASKSAVQKLTPKTTEIIRKALDTPFYRQGDIPNNFAEVMVRELAIDPANVDKAKAVLAEAMRAKVQANAKKALEAAMKALTPREIQTLKPGKPFWKRLEELLNAEGNAAGLTTGNVLEELARRRGQRPPTASEKARMKDLAEREMRMRELTPSQKADAGESPEAQAKALLEIETETRGPRSKIIREMHALWSRFTRPLSFRHYWANKENNVAALNEFETANLLLKVGFAGLRLPTHIFTQLLWHIPTRAAGIAWQKYDVALAKGNPTALWNDVGNAMLDGWKTSVAAWRPALRAFGAAMAGRVESRNVDRLLSGIAAFDRIALKMQELKDAGHPAQAGALWLVRFPEFALRFVQGIDSLQGVPVEMAEIMHQIREGMEKDGRPEIEIVAQQDKIRERLPEMRDAAITQTAAHFAEKGITAGESEITENAWNLVRTWIYEQVRAMNLPADEFRTRNELLRRVVSWQERADTGLGGVVATAGRGISAAGASVGLPISFTRFANAIGTGLNYMLMQTPLSPLGAATFRIPGITNPKGSPWARYEWDRYQLRVKWILGTILGGVLIGLILKGLIRVNLKSPRDKEERALWEAQGRRAGTMDIMQNDHQFRTISLTVGPGSLLAPYAAAAGAWVDLAASRTKKQAKLNEEAEKLGLTPGTIAPINAADWMGVAADAFWGAIMGNKAFAGMSQSITEHGELVSQKSLAAFVSPVLPGLPGYQELTRMAGIDLDPKLATFWDYLVPTTTSGKKATNFLGDPVGTPNSFQRAVQTAWAGNYPWLVDSDQLRSNPAYAAVFSSGWRPPSIDPNKGYAINGEYRPLTDSELQEYTVKRGKYLKEELTDLGPDASKQAAQQAYQRANQQALGDIGVNTGRSAPATARGGAATPAGAGAAAAGAGVTSTPRLASARARGATRPRSVSLRRAGAVGSRGGGLGLRRGVRGPSLRPTGHGLALGRTRVSRRTSLRRR